MKPRHFRSLRRTLQGALDSRQMTLMNGRCKRKDFDAISVSMWNAQSFLNSYPVATNQRVREWCLVHREDVSRIVPASQRKVLSRLLVDELDPA